jgi:hypothetical protein
MRGVLVLFVVVVVATVALSAQSWTPPKTSWGEPDLQGYWPSVEMLGVPFERPVGEHAILTDEEFARLPSKRRTPNANDFFFGDSRDHWRDYGKPQRQTSLIVDPPDGRLPPFTPDGARRAATLPNESRGSLNGPEHASNQARCLSRGAFGSMMPIGNSSGNQIIQAPGVVAIRNEMIHETRVIFLDGRPHVGAAIRGHIGDSRGRWDGHALVVETTNFNDNSGGTRPFSHAARLTERFERVDPDTICYVATIDDPTTWTRPWTVAFPLKRDPGYYLFEFACHEGNYLSMTSMLGGARLAERRASQDN